MHSIGTSQAAVGSERQCLPFILWVTRFFKGLEVLIRGCGSHVKPCNHKNFVPLYTGHAYTAVHWQTHKHGFKCLLHIGCYVYLELCITSCFQVVSIEGSDADCYCFGSRGILAA